MKSWFLATALLLAGCLETFPAYNYIVAMADGGVIDGSPADMNPRDGGPDSVATDMATPDAQPDAEQTDSSPADGTVDLSHGCLPTGEEVCDNIDNDCNGNTDESAGNSTPCSTNEPGACERGSFVCENSATICRRDNNPDTESCNGIDDDCDGNTDEDFGLGDDCIEGEGACAVPGMITCAEGEATCSVEAGKPAEEVCDGADNDCDGIADEGMNCQCMRPDSQGCYTGPRNTENRGSCRGGTQRCNDENQWDPCEGQILPRAEVCDGLDNDCNGEVDDAPGVGRGCSTGVGECVAQGVEICTPNGVQCNARARNPADEVCDGADNDCDGNTDEDFELGLPCIEGIGACQANGQIVCDANGDATCDAEPDEPSPEICGGQDEDCDGVADEDLGLGEICNAGLGACRRQGQLICDEFADPICNTRPGVPSAEVTCDNVNNDCDGNTDEGFGLGEACFAGQCPGGEGQFICENGAVSCSGNAVPPIDEVCNGADENCNGAIDEGLAGAPCETGLLGICAQGQRTCEDGHEGCEPPPRTPEVCDGADNDCNGRVDDNPACSCEVEGEFVNCYDGPAGTADVGECQSALAFCNVAEGRYGSCGGQILPAEEICDSQDNDCDGQTDENLRNACGNCGPLPQEVCDSEDNDCDDQTDEGFNTGVACQVGQGSCYAEGTIVCDGNGDAICSALAGNPSDERCDGADNDCNGGIDDGLICPLWVNVDEELDVNSTEVSILQYASCVNFGPCVAPQESGQALRCNWQTPGLDPRNPANCVTRDQAMLYCDWVEGFLPSREQWQTVARGGRINPLYAWENGNPDCNHAHTDLCQPRRTIPVGQLQAGTSPQEVFDLHGNVRELTATDELNGEMVVMGGGWAEPIVSIDQVTTVPSFRRSVDTGFRCVRRTRQP